MLTSRTHALGLAYAKAYGQPCCALAKRLLRHEDELFQFVLIEGLSADNNSGLSGASGPLVVIRKISGGSRSAEGNEDAGGLKEPVRDLAGPQAQPLAECPSS